MKPIVVVLLDGLGDRAYPELDGQTANEAASTPRLDEFCARASCGLLWPLGPGRAPSSETAHWCMLGYHDDEFPGRAVFEAQGAGRSVDNDAVYAFAALRPAVERDGALWLTGRPSQEEHGACELMVGAVSRCELDGFTFSLSHLQRGEAILRIDGGASPDVSDTDPFFRDRDPVMRPRSRAAGGGRTARVTEAWTSWVYETLRDHTVNRQRVRQGLDPLSVITLKWWGRQIAAWRFRQRHGLEGALLGGSPFLWGLAQTVGLEPVKMPESADPGADLEERLERAAELLEDGASFVFSHQKATDEAGHAKRQGEKVRVIESIDRAVARLAEPPFADAVVCITGDHTTPSSSEVIHSGDPVPFALAGPGVRADSVTAFGEESQRAGILGHITGADVMPVLLNAADRPLFAGSRPGVDQRAQGHPLNPEAFALPKPSDQPVTQEVT